mmetsp:Transcript_6017/g.14667  ORF Transcript_6017/g.14667 Transcript_6017/m.14667 type:complete len:231 (+) Transcript_6017:706-1398(+)
MPMIGRSRCVMSNSTMKERKKTSPMSSPCMPAGDGCTHVCSVSARYHDDAGISHFLPPTTSQNDLVWLQCLANVSHGTFFSAPPELSAGITRHDVPESRIDGRPIEDSADGAPPAPVLNCSSSIESATVSPNWSEVAPTMKSSGSLEPTYHMVPLTVSGSYPPSCTSASSSVEKKENFRCRPGLAAWIEKRIGCGMLEYSRGSPKPRMPSTPLKSGLLQSVMTPKGASDS